MTIRFHTAPYVIYAAWKAIIVIGSAMGVWLYALDPNVEIALIVSSPGILTAILGVITFFNNRAKERRDNERRVVDDERHAATMEVMGKVQKNTDGLMSEKVKEVAQLTTD